MGVCHHRAQPRYPVEASIRTENLAPPRRGFRTRTTPAATEPTQNPQAPQPQAGWFSIRNYNNQGGETHPPRKYQGRSGKIPINSTSAGTHGGPVSQRKNPLWDFTRGNQIHPIPNTEQPRQEDRAHLSHPTNWGIMNQVATAPRRQSNHRPVVSSLM